MVTETIKYIILELLEKVYRLKSFILKHNLSETSNSNGNVVLLFNRTITKILNHLEETTLQIDGLTEDEAFTIQRRLAQNYEAIIGLHDELKYLHTEWLRPEIFTFANHIINYLPKECRPGIINIILSDKYSFLEKNLFKEFIEVVSGFSNDSTLKYPERSPTVILPKIEYNNPLNWPILCHELGHIDETNIANLISKKELFPSGISVSEMQILKNWAEEIYCDFFATNIIGPAYYLSLSTFALLNSLRTGIGVSSNTHPPFTMRMAILYSYLDHNHLNISIKKEGKECSIHHYFYEMLNIVDEVLLKFPGLQIQESEIKGLNIFNDYLRDNYDSYKNIIFKIENHELEDIKILIDKLVNKMPIGSLRNLAKDQEYIKLLDNIEIAPEVFGRIRNSLSENGSELWKILNAGWVYKFENIIPVGKNLFFEKNDYTFENKLDLYGEELDVLDDRLLVSIETSKLIYFVEN